MPDIFWKNTQNIKFHEIQPVEAELFHADRHDESQQSLFRTCLKMKGH